MTASPQQRSSVLLGKGLVANLHMVKIVPRRRSWGRENEGGLQEEPENHEVIQEMVAVVTIDHYHKGSIFITDSREGIFRKIQCSK